MFASLLSSVTSFEKLVKLKALRLQTICWAALLNAVNKVGAKIMLISGSEYKHALNENLLCGISKEMVYQVIQNVEKRF